MKRIKFLFALAAILLTESFLLRISLLKVQWQIETVNPSLLPRFR